MSSIQYAILNDGFTKFFKDMFGPSVKAAYYSKFNSNTCNEEFENSMQKSNQSWSDDFINYDKNKSVFDFDVDGVLIEFVTDHIVEIGVSGGYPLQLRPVDRSDIIFIKA